MPLPPYLQIAAAALACMGLMAALWLVQRRTRNAGIVDLAWAAAIGAQGLFYAATSGGYGPRRLLVAVLIGLWSLRLSVYLARRVLGHPEEGRYARLRADWGDAADRRLFWFFQMQAAAAFGFALPVLAAAHNATAALTWLDYGGVVLWAAGIAGTALADWQLERFKRCPDSRGKTCRDGLWRYSRHPNYFFEWLHWWAYVPLSFGVAAWWLTPAVPLVLLYFLLRVTGIPPTEAQALASRGEDYRRYQRTTSAFIPWFPRKEQL